jgi:hypothetical protein
MEVQIWILIKYLQMIKKVSCDEHKLFFNRNEGFR